MTFVDPLQLCIFSDSTAFKDFIPCRFETRLVRKNLLYIILKFNFILDTLKFILDEKLSAETK